MIWATPPSLVLILCFVLPDALGDGDELARRETLTLIRAFNRIKDGEKRERLIDLVQALGEAEGEEAEIRHDA